MKKAHLIFIAFCVFHMLALSQVITFPTTITTTHPRVLADKDSLMAFKQRVASNTWMSSIINTFKSNVDAYVTRHQTDTAWIVSRLQMYWKYKYTNVYTMSYAGDYYSYFDHGDPLTPAPVPTVKINGSTNFTNYATPSLENVVPYSDSTKMYLQNNTTKAWEWTDLINTGDIIQRINDNILEKASNAAVLYWYTGEPKYGKFAYDIFKTFMYGIRYRNLPICLGSPTEANKLSTYMGYENYSDIHDEGLPSLVFCYDFLYDYITTKAPSDVLPNTGAYPVTFKKWADRFFVGGIPSNNWNVIEANYIALSALVLENNSAYADGKGCQWYLDQIFNVDYPNQYKLTSSINNISSTSYLWNESPGYSIGAPAGILAIVQLVDRVTKNNLLNQLPLLKKNIPGTAQYLFPNLYATGFGDTGYTNLDPTPTEGLISIARQYNNAAAEDSATQLIDMTYGYKYVRPKTQDVYTLFQYVDALKKPSIPGALQNFTTAGFYASNVSYYMQRNGFDKTTSLAASINSFNGNHSHHNGISMELYGKGYVLGVDGCKGSDAYGGTIHQEFNVRFPAHNTVVVNGKSDSGNAYTLLNNYPASQQKSGYFPGITFCNVKLDESTTGSDQQRLTGTIRTGTTSGYYVDIFRSKVRAGNDVKHEYFYHNTGQTKTLSDTLGQVLTPILLSGGKFPVNTDFSLPGYSYFNNVSSVDYTKSFNANFKLTDGVNVVNMNMWMKGSTERKIYLAETSKNQGFRDVPVTYKNLAVPTVVVQQTGEAWNRPFVAVFEPYSNTQGKTVTTINSFTPVGADADFVGLTVQSLTNRKETIFSAVRNKAVTMNDMTFNGKYGVVCESGSQFNYIYLGAGISIGKGAWSITSVNVADSSCNATYANEVDGIHFTASAPVNLTVPDTFVVGKPVVFSIKGTPIQYAGTRSTLGGVKIVTFTGIQATDYALVNISTGNVPAFVSAIPGTIEAENYDLGGEGVSCHDIEITNFGGKYRADGVDIQSCSAGGVNVGWMVSGEWLNYTVNVKETGNYLLQIKTATNKSTAKFHVTFNGVDKTGILTVPNTGDWQTWTTISIPVSLTAGTQVMKFYVDGNVADSYIFNLDKLILLGEQSVNFAALTKYISDIDFSPATSTSGLPITYSSSNASVATVVNGLIHIVGMGTSTITASQGGNELYLPATNVSQILTVKNKPTGLNDITSNSIHIYPNPVQDKAIVQLETSVINDATLNIYNSIGILVMTQKIDSQSSILDMSKLTNGIYYVRITNGGENISKKMVKN